MSDPDKPSVGMLIFKIFLWSLGIATGLIVLLVGLVLGTCFFGR
jgi:hypothetical protein